MIALDPKDEKILAVLKENAKYSSKQLAKKTGIPLTTVHNRIKKLERDGIIKGYTTILNNELLGNITAFVNLSVEYHHQGKVIDQEALAQDISKNEHVQEVNIITGSSDLVIKVRTKTIEELNYFVIKYLRNLSGIDKTQTSVVLKAVEK